MALFTSAGIASALSVTAGFFTQAAALALNTAVGIGTSLIAKAVAGKGKSGQQQATAINGKVRAGGAVPRSFMLGIYATGGSFVWGNTWGEDGGTPNAYLTQVFAISDLPVAGLAELWVNGARVFLNLAAPHPFGLGYPVIGYEDSLWVKFYDGTQTTADPFLVNVASNAQRVWGATRVGTGVAYAICTARVTKNRFAGIPQFRFATYGAKLYDPSRDSTVGGVGPQRHSTPSTWGGDGDNLPAVQAYNLLRGMTFGGKWLYGLQNVGAARLPVADWIAKIEKCRTAIPTAYGPMATWLSAGEITVDTPLATAIEAINTTCQGRIAEAGGVYTMAVGEPEAPSFSITDGDILSTEEQTFTPFFGLADAINGVVATYPSPLDGWTTKTAPPLYRADLEAKHGGRRLMASVSLDFCPYPEQVQRVVRAALQEAQRARRHTFVLPPAYWAYAVPGAVLSWTSARNGYVAKLFRIDGVNDLPNLDVMVDITEVDPADYDWDSETDFQPPVDGALGPMLPVPQPIVDWYAVGDFIADSAGTPRRPAVRLEWDNAPSRIDDVIGVEYELRLASTLERVYGGRTDRPEVGSIKIAPFGLLPATSYGVRGRFIAGSDRPTLWSDWLPALTPDIRFGGFDLYDGVIDLDKLSADMQALHAYVGSEVRDLVEQTQAIALRALDQDLANYADKKEVRERLTAQYEDITAGYTSAIYAATGPGSALAGRIEEVEVALDGVGGASGLLSLYSRLEVAEDTIELNSAALIDVSAALAGKASASSVLLLDSRVTGTEGNIVAMANALIGVAAGLGGNGSTADVNMRFTATAAPGGYLARWALQGRVNTADLYKSAGLYADVSALTSRIVIEADQVVITKSGTYLQPFVFDAVNGWFVANGIKAEFSNLLNVSIGTAHIQNGAIVNAKIGNLEVDRIKIANRAVTDPYGPQSYGPFGPLAPGFYLVEASLITVPIASTDVGATVYSNATLSVSAAGRVGLTVVVRVLGVDINIGNNSFDVLAAGPVFINAVGLLLPPGSGNYEIRTSISYTTLTSPANFYINSGNTVVFAHRR